MRFYIWFENFTDLVLRRLWVLVVWVHELRKIRRKKALFSKIHLKPEQVQEIDQIWQQAYGKKISKNWHRLYQSYIVNYAA